MKSERRAFLALGTNLGDRLTNLEEAVARLGQGGVRVLRSSQVYETEPVGPPQPNYLNAVIEVETALSPRELMTRCLDIEDDMGRERGERWGPRVIDVDILTYGEEEIDEPDLQVPHPRMHERAFVMIPLLELDADPKLPGGRSVSTLRMEGWPMGGVRPFAPPLGPPSTRPSTGA